MAGRAGFRGDQALKGADPAQFGLRKNRGCHLVSEKPLRAESIRSEKSRLLHPHLSPYRAMVGRLFHGADIVIDSSFPADIQKSAGQKEMVDAQAPLGLVLETTATVVEPAETVVNVRTQLPKAVAQAPVQEMAEPLALLRQKAGFAGTQPAFGVIRANADVRIQGGDVEIAHHHEGFSRIAILVQKATQIIIKFSFGGKFDRMVAVFPLGEVAVDDCQRLSGCKFEHRADKTLLRFLAVPGKTEAQLDRFPTKKEGHPVMGFLATEGHTITEFLDRREGKIFILDLGLLQTDNLGAVFFCKGLQLMKAGTNAVDVKRYNFHDQIFPFYKINLFG